MYRYKAQYSLDCNDGIETASILNLETLEEIFERKERTRQLHAAIGQLTQMQQRRSKAYFFESLNFRQIAEMEKQAINMEGKLLIPETPEEGAPLTLVVLH